MSRLVRLAVPLLYGGVGLAVLMAWVWQARTEGWDGQMRETWPSVAANAAGQAPNPFVGRRLLPEVAQLLARLIPESAVGWLDSDTDFARSAKHLLVHKLNWRPDAIPLMLAATLLWYASVVGFMLAVRKLVELLYAGPGWVPHAVGLALGVALLGGSAGHTDSLYPASGPMRWFSYHYDLPQACVFAVGLVGVVGRRGWLWAMFPIAAYSKETSALLIVAYVVVPVAYHWRWKAAGAAGLVAIFVAVRLFVRSRFPSPPEFDFFYPLRNLELVVVHGGLFQSWWLPVYAVFGLAVLRQWGRFPVELRWLLVLIPLEVGACFVKGWLEERRAYYELLPVVGILAIQTVLLEARLGWLMRSRADTATPPTRADGSGLYPVPSTAAELSALFDHLYRHTGGLARVLVCWRPFIVPFESILARISPGGTVLDVGCGAGFLSVAAAATGLAKSVRGFDTSAQAIGIANQVALPPAAGPANYEVLPVDRWPEGMFDTVLVVDVLHHVPPAAHTDFLAKVCRSVAPGGRLIYKDIAPTPRWKAAMNRLHDLLLARQWVRYATEQQVAGWVTANGLTVTDRGRWDRLWYPHYYVIATKPAA
jgi:2-polyprenyl-3-methyl-5-hydroxy-6-metoxy-1,4-benzoquinol methylase